MSARSIASWTLLRGLRIYRSGCLPMALGAILALAGGSFIIRNALLVLAPAFASDLFLLPIFVAGLSLTLWLLVKGVDIARWEARQSLDRSTA